MKKCYSMLFCTHLQLKTYTVAKLICKQHYISCKNCRKNDFNIVCVLFTKSLLKKHHIVLQRQNRNRHEWRKQAK